jgi:hypothetical protein
VPILPLSHAPSVPVKHIFRQIAVWEKLRSIGCPSSYQATTDLAKHLTLSLLAGNPAKALMRMLVHIWDAARPETEFSHYHLGLVSIPVDF